MKRFFLVLMALCLMIPGLCASAEQTANGLTITGTLELEYATQFRADGCKSSPHPYRVSRSTAASPVALAFYVCI